MLLKALSLFSLLVLVKNSWQQDWNNQNQAAEPNGYQAVEQNGYGYESGPNQAQLKGEFFQSVPQQPAPVKNVQVQNGDNQGNRPYPIKQETFTNTGEKIIENLIGGIPFDCTTRPTGHWRDENYCDIFHACVYGQRRKTYVCPIVGERTYFDEVTKKCEFMNQNPTACSKNQFYL